MVFQRVSEEIEEEGLFEKAFLTFQQLISSFSQEPGPSSPSQNFSVRMERVGVTRVAVQLEEQAPSNPFNELVKIPLVIRLPYMTSPGSRITAPASLVDLLPTLLELSGIEASDEKPGVSLLSAIQGERGPSPPGPIYGEVLAGDRNAWFVTEGRYKLLRYEKGGSEVTFLFDLLTDPMESHDLSDSMPQVRDSLVSKMEETYAKSASKAVRAEEVKIDESTEERLKALGYIQ